MRRVRFKLPAGSVSQCRRQLRRRIFEERASQRYFLLSGLKAIGFDVPDSELARDARREDRS